MSSSSNLNSAGQASVATAGSFAVNAVVHPICTVKTILMAGEPTSRIRVLGLRGLYSGYFEMCLTESLSFGTSYIVNGISERNKINPMLSSVLAGIASAPVVTIGEALMVNRQLNAIPLNLALRSAVRISGLFATMNREIPFCVAIFFMPGVIEKKIGFRNRLATEIASGLIAGSMRCPNGSC